MTTLSNYNYSTDLAALVAADLGQEPKRSGKWITFLCPFPGHKHNDKRRDLAVVNPTNSRPAYWKCFGCGRHGSPVDWWIEYHGKKKEEVIEMLRQNGQPSAPMAPRPPALIQPPAVIGNWQDRAHAFMERCKVYLWSEAGKPAREYLLNERHFTESMLHTWDIGFNPSTRYENKTDWGLTPLEGESPKMMLRRGVVIPCFESGIISYIKIRVLPKELQGDEPKYRKLAGSQPGIMGLDTVLNSEIVFATEGELNLIPLWAAINRVPTCYKIGAISFGSASDYQALKPNIECFLPVRRIIAYFDQDKAGMEARQRLLEMSGKVEFAKLNAKDFADYHQNGNELSAWVQYQIARAHFAD